MRKLIFLLGLMPLLSAVAFGQEHTAQLSWEESSCSVKSVAFRRDEPFGKEPPLSGGIVLRGVLSWGVADSKLDAGLLWDVDARKLFVDMNADGDLTNDGDPLLSDDPSPEYQSFPDFAVSFTSAEGKRIFRLSPTLRNASWGQQAEFSVASAYTGDIELHGRTWSLKVWDNLDSPLTESPYYLIAEKDENGRISDSGYFRMPHSVFVGGRCYDIALAPNPQPDGHAGITCTLTERDVPTGTLAIKGQWVRRLVLAGAFRALPNTPGGDRTNRMLVIPQLTEDPVTVPAGTFNIEKCGIQRSDDSRAFGPIPYGWEKSVTITEGQTAELAIGGPLKQTVDVRRTGSMLTFSYALKGAGGEPYDIRPLYNYDYSKKPSVAIYKGDMQLATGTFEYG
jgi:hypothetical protein